MSLVFVTNRVPMNSEKMTVLSPVYMKASSFSE